MCLSGSLSSWLCKQHQKRADGYFFEKGKRRKQFYFHNPLIRKNKFPNCEPNFRKTSKKKTQKTNCGKYIERRQTHLLWTVPVCVCVCDWRAGLTLWFMRWEQMSLTDFYTLSLVIMSGSHTFPPSLSVICLTKTLNVVFSDQHTNTHVHKPHSPTLVRQLSNHQQMPPKI